MNRSRPVAAGILFVIATLVMTGCGDQSAQRDGPSSDQPPKFDVIEDLDESQLAQKKRAETVRDQMMQNLMDELMKALSTGGPAESSQVCKTVAPEVAKQLSKQGIRIGRTSFKLRNPDNSPPKWAESFVEQLVAEPTFVELQNQTLGALLPIRLKSTCLICHGNNQQIAPAVKTALVNNYPRDQATGFAEGDLRGYFWVEVDADPQSKN